MDILRRIAKHEQIIPGLAERPEPPEPPEPAEPPEPVKPVEVRPKNFKLSLPKMHYDLGIRQRPTIQIPERKSITLLLPSMHHEFLMPPVSEDPTTIDRPNLSLNIPVFHHELGIKPDEEVSTETQDYELGIWAKPRPPEPIPLPMTKFVIPKFVKLEQKPEVPTDNDGIKLTPNNIPKITIQENSPANIARLYYNKPERNDLAVLLVFFDYIGSARILINYLFMVEKLKLADIPVFTLELVIHGKKPKIHDAMHVYGSSYLFQKEHLLRLLEKTIPVNYTKLVCLDADVIFENSNWYDNLSILLDTNHIIQCFDVSYWLDLSYTKLQKSAASCISADRSKRFWNDQSQPVHPGFGWAFRRNQYRTSGFFDKAVIGSGDTLFAYGLLGYPINVDDRETVIYKNAYGQWMSRWKQINYTCLNGNLYHLYHGPIPNRQYISRYDAFKGISNIEEVLAVNNYGVYELTQPKLNRAMLEFFKTRDDDGL